jgi:hypothetical protein
VDAAVSQSEGETVRPLSFGESNPIKAARATITLTLKEVSIIFGVGR